MHKLFLLTAFCALGVAACSHLRVPDDQQLGTLLAAQNASPTDANAPLDTNLIDCLRAWSDDTELLKGLSVRFAGEDGKDTCRTTLDTRIADGERNPDKFSFDELRAPKVVRRAMDLQAERRMAATVDPAQRRIPPALTQARPAPAKFAPPDPSVDLGLAGTRLNEAEALCQEARQAAAEPGAGSSLKRFASHCPGPLRKLRRTLETSARHGRSAEQLATMADSADNMATVARQVLAQPR